jgi:RNA polymerase sigma-70 factor (ECF subfamily)
MTTTTRICLDQLRSARSRREEYVGPWLPDPVVDAAALAPDSQTELAEDLSVALMLALDRLSPLERAAFLLRDVFDYSFAEVARALGRSEVACRQLAARARVHVRTTRPDPRSPSSDGSTPESDRHAELVSAFVSATRSGDLSSLMGLLTRDARIVSDGGGKVAAALNVIEGADHVARFLVGTARKGWTDDIVARLAMINGLPGLIFHGPDGVIQTVALEVEGDVARTIYVVRNPDKLNHLAGITGRPEGTERAQHGGTERTEVI